MPDINFHEIQPDELADSYAQDPRVDTHPGKGGYNVRRGDEEYYVMHAALFGWTLCQGPNLEFVQLPQGGVSEAHFAIGMDSAGEIIRALVGEPQLGLVKEER
jgi:hypothetical protein